jgi:hypothetical protein
MANQLSANTLFGSGYSGRANLERVKNNTPFGYYDNDSEFIKDAQKASAFVAQRLGVGGTANATTYITELTVYAAMEEAVTTYGNMVYQYKIRDNYLSLEGSPTLPFNQTDTGDKIVLSEEINTPVFWSDGRTATWAEIGYDLPNSASAAGGEIYVSSASINDFAAPDLNKLNNWNFYYYQTPSIPGYENFDFSQTTYPQFSKAAGATVTTRHFSETSTTFDISPQSIFSTTPGSASFSITSSDNTYYNFIITASTIPNHYSASYGTFNVTDLAITASNPGSSSFSVTSSNGLSFFTFKITGSAPSDTATNFYIVTGSTAAQTSYNIATKINSVTSNFGITIVAKTGSSSPTILELTSSYTDTLTNPIGSFRINYIDGNNTPQSTTLTSIPFYYNVPDDDINNNTFYIAATGSNANDTANNIAKKISEVTSYFGFTVTAATGSSTPTTLDLVAPAHNDVTTFFDPSINFQINNDTPTQAVFPQPAYYDTYNITSGNSWIYFFTGYPIQTLFYNGARLDTAYYQDILKGRGLNGKIIGNNLQSQIRIAESYAQEAGVGGYVTEYTGSIPLVPNKQNYDLNAWAAASASLETGDRIEIRQIFYQEPPAIVRYFDPYAGTGTGVQGLLETFGFGSYSPGINFMLMPVYWDVMKIQAIEFNDQVRKSAFSFDLVNNQLRVFPVPTNEGTLLFKYMKQSEKNLPVIDQRPNVVADVMGVPYRNPIYTDINQVGRSWVFRFTLALCKEIEGQIRATFQGSNFGGLIVNGSELLTDARSEKESLMAELKEYLDQTTRRSQLERKQAESEFSRQTMNQIPLLIYAL